MYVIIFTGQLTISSAESLTLGSDRGRCCECRLSVRSYKIMTNIGINTDTCISTNFTVMTHGMIIACSGSLVNVTTFTMVDRVLTKITILLITKVFITYILKKREWC